VWMSSKSKTIVPAGIPNMPAGMIACMIFRFVGITRKYQSWNLLMCRGSCRMTRFGRKCLPLSYFSGQFFDHLMASTSGYFLTAWCSLLLMTSLSACVGTSLTWFSGLN
jgi:hypothetical protein